MNHQKECELLSLRHLEHQSNSCRSKNSLTMRRWSELRKLSESLILFSLDLKGHPNQAMNAKRKAVLDRIESLEKAISKAREYLETGKHAHWSGFRPLFDRKF